MSVKHKKTVLLFENLGAMQMLSQMQQLKHLRIKNRVSISQAVPDIFSVLHVNRE